MSSFIPWAVAVLFASLAGIVWFRFSSAKQAKSLLEQRNGDLTNSLESARRDLAQAQSESAVRAGFEALAAERERTADGLRAELQANTESERSLNARVKELEADLRNERQNIAEKIALLETAKKTLSDQF
ncbi:MAG: hypothetical protein WB341_16190, partial [Terracidiphilus sp.]